MSASAGVNMSSIGTQEPMVLLYWSRSCVMNWVKVLFEVVQSKQNLTSKRQDFWYPAGELLIGQMLWQHPLHNHGENHQTAADKRTTTTGHDRLGHHKRYR